MDEPEGAEAVVPTSRIRFRDLVSESVAGLSQRPSRSALTAFGTLLGVAVMVAVLGLTSSATAQIGKRFSLLAATEVTVEQQPSTVAVGSLAFPPDAERRVMAINGVQHAGLDWGVDPARSGPVSALPPGQQGAPAATATQVRALSPGGFAVMRVHVRQGRTFDETAQNLRARVAVLGVAAARDLQVADLSSQPTIFIGGVSFTVIGIVDDMQRHADALAQVIVPSTTAVSLWGDPIPTQPARMIIETASGATAVVGQQVPVALRPDRPDLLRPNVPPDPRTLRDAVNTDLSSLFLILALVCLIVGMVGIANTTFVAVIERVPEIGLRRALGARARHIAVQFLVESSFLGLLGGLVGSAVGVIVVLGVSLAESWTAVLPPQVALAGPVIGALTGLVAGSYPAYRAARIEPMDALRSSG